MKKLIAAMFILTLSSPVFAMPNKVVINALTEQYPTTMGTKLMDCMTCHVIDKWQRNDFGRHLQNHLRAIVEQSGQNVPAANYTKAFIMNGLKAIELGDSDNDGFSNLEELMHVTSPGNSEDYPERPVLID